MLFSILGIMLGVSCSDSDDEMGDEGDGGTTATTPFKSLKEKEHLLLSWSVLVLLFAQMLPASVYRAVPCFLVLD